MDLAQLLVNGVALGCAYALVALGFVLVINATGAVNFAHGDLVMVGGFLAVWLGARTGLPGLVLLPAAVALMAALGVALGFVGYWPLRARPQAVFISTIALGIILAAGANALFGAAPRAGPPVWRGGGVTLAGVVVARQALWTIAVAGLLIALTWAVLHRTQLGRSLRASAEDREMARAIGIRVGWMVALSFALAAALAGAAGLLLAHQFFVTPGEGGALMLKAYVATALAGWGRIGGAALAALLIALFETLVAAWLSHPVAEALLYVVLLATLMARPSGLFGEAASRRA
jgi:branched-chain amino acid transport system permease protein